MQLSNLKEHFYKVSQFKVVDMLRLRQGKTDAKFGRKNKSILILCLSEKDAFQNLKSNHIFRAGGLLNKYFNTVFNTLLSGYFQGK